MKNIFLLSVAVSLCLLVDAQVPESFSYQVIVRDVSNNPVTNQNVSFRMSILKGSASGISQYSEVHSANTGDLGLVNLAIGSGSSKTGDITTIEWGTDIYFLKVEIDAAGGSSFTLMGTTQLLSVPYAMHSGKSETVDYNSITNKPEGTNPGDMQYWNGTGWIIIPAGTEGQILTFKGGKPIWTDPVYGDDDGDGYNEEGGDCDDTDNTIYPGADEICGDGIDQDCDGNDAVCGDSDGDGYNEMMGDCDDGNPSVYPGADEVMDAADNDCDGVVDEGLIPAGAVIITEIMVDPTVSDALGEWFEVTNVWSNTINLNSFVIKDNGTNIFSVNAPGGILLAPGESAVICANDDPVVNGGVTADYEWSNFTIANTGGDEIILTLDGVEIDRVENIVSITTGRSLSLDPGSYDAVKNNDLTGYWCLTAITPDYQLAGGDYGTPGEINPSCSGAPAIALVSPSAGIDAGGETVMITGSGFTGVTAVKIGGTVCSSFTITDDNHISCITPAHAYGDCDVEVIKGADSGISANGYRFTGVGSVAIYWGALKWPSETSTYAGVVTENIYGQVWSAGVTGTPGPPAGIIAQVGWGPHGTDPGITPGWTWYPASWNRQEGENDEFFGTLLIPYEGTYSYTYRFSDDDGYRFLYVDYGQGTADGFSTSDLGTATVE